MRFPDIPHKAAPLLRREWDKLSPGKREYLALSPVREFGKWAAEVVAAARNPYERMNP